MYSDVSGGICPRNRLNLFKNMNHYDQVNKIDLFSTSRSLSECGGNSEADDFLDVSRKPSSSTPLHSSTFQDIVSTSTTRLNENNTLRSRGMHVGLAELNYGIRNDDSDKDPDFALIQIIDNFWAE
ncbi:hypothetical protein J6590_087263 [Homalodisca vitripennis]|nr:hypothetical protein J6590_087263 [Homalodisca vitripennis]